MYLELGLISLNTLTLSSKPCLYHLPNSLLVKRLTLAVKLALIVGVLI